MPDGSIDLTVVTPERAIVHEQVDELQIPGAAGYFGVLPGHAPLFSELKIGEVSYRQGDRWFFISVAWGFAEVAGSEGAATASQCRCFRSGSIRNRRRKIRRSDNPEIV